MNNKNFTIISDGSCDLPDEIVKEKDIKVVPFYISFDGNTYLKEKVDIGVQEFYNKLVNEPNVYPKTTMPAINDYVTAFEEEIVKGNDIICICITTKFSGSYNSAMSAKDICLEKYPDAKITVVDSMVNTGLQGLLVLEVIRMKQDGLAYEKIVENIEKLKKTGRIYFTVGSLDYLRHGGRIGKLMAIVGATLKIKPIIVLRDGEIFSEGISFTRTKSFIRATNLAIEYFNKNKFNMNEYQFITGYGYDEEEGKNFHKRFEELIGRKDVLNLQIGATIGVHTGPYPLGIGFIKKYEYL